MARAVAGIGLAVRGGFHPEAGDGVPTPSGLAATETVVLLGNVGPAMWRAFSDAPEAALDEWTRRVTAPLAAGLGADVVYPFDGPPFLPFQRWAQRAGPVVPSPLGLLVHPDFGLWHAYRAALLFPGRLVLPANDNRPPPCHRCAGQPCLAGCPVGAFGAEGYDVARCIAHLSGEEGAPCMSRGCQARHACPAGTDYRYVPAQAAFHMNAFLAAGRTRKQERT